MAIDILVCNLTRLGDLLQTQPLIDDLHKNGLRVGLLCLENFAGAASLLRNVSQIWTMPGARICAELDKNWPDALRDILDFAARIAGEGKPRFALNLTPTLPGRIFTRLMALHGARPLGFGMDDYGFGANYGFWASFLEVGSQKRANTPFNLADMLRRMALPIINSLPGSGALADPSVDAQREAGEILAQKTADAKGFVAFQLGASDDRRRWPVEHFRQLGRIIWEKTGHMPVLLGSRAETALGEKYAANAAHPFIDAMGKTDIPVLGALLRQCRLLVTNDTGTMHLAAGMGVPSLAFFLATAQPWDTGPLLSGCCCLEPNLRCHPCQFGAACPYDNKCRGTVSPQAAADLVCAWLEGDDWNAGLTPAVNQCCRVWLTGQDADGMFQVRRACAQKDDDRGLWLAWLRNFWRQLLDEMDKSDKGEKEKSTPAPAREYPDRAPALAKDTIGVMEQASSLLQSLRECGELALRNPRGGQIFLRHCERLQALLDDCAPLGGLGAFWREMRRNHASDLQKFLPLLSILAENLKKFGIELAKSI